nr:type II secretion system protein GspM [uncultured Pantoea sp.]
MNKIKTVWHSRTQREQRLVMLAGISLLIMLIVSTTQQLSQWRDMQRLAFEQEIRAVSTLIVQEAELPQPTRHLTLEDITRQAREKGFTLEFSAIPEGYRLTTAQPVAFQPLMQWLTQLEQCCALYAHQLTYERREDARFLTTLVLTYAE